MKVLVFGFAPFLRYARNVSGDIAKEFDKATVGKADVIGEVLDVEHKKSAEAARKRILAEKPDAVIGFGIAGTRGCVSLERVALNWYYYRSPKGEVDEALYSKGPGAYFSTLPLKEIKKDLEKRGIPADYSFWADTFVSNELFYEIMRTAEKSRIKQAGFIHLPATPDTVIDLKDVHYANKLNMPSLPHNLLGKAARTIIETVARSH